MLSASLNKKNKKTKQTRLLDNMVFSIEMCMIIIFHIHDAKQVVTMNREKHNERPGFYKTSELSNKKKVN